MFLFKEGCYLMDKSNVIIEEIETEERIEFVVTCWSFRQIDEIISKLTMLLKQ